MEAFVADSAGSVLAMFVGFEVILEEVLECEVLLAGGVGAMVCRVVCHMSQVQVSE